MFTTAGSTGISKAFQWIFMFANITIPGFSITLWQFAVGILLFKTLWGLALRLLNTHMSGYSYKSSSYYGKPREENKQTIKEAKNGD